MARRRSLAQILAYRNDEVVHRFSVGWNVRVPAARELFADTKRYLWLSEQTEFLIPPIRIIDEMWHTFIVFTREYRRFCESYLGGMFDHEPTPRAEFRAMGSLMRRNPARAQREAAARYERWITTVMAKLGERVALRWYVDYPERYGPRFFKRGYRPQYVDDLKFPAALRRRAARR